MYPLDPARPASADPKSSMAPPYVDENPNMEMTEMGLRIAENEKRDSATEEYEAAALSSDETEESLDDIDYPKGEGEPPAPELSAITRQGQQQD